jgi:RNA polymerase sigma-70 factor (ECF subfamily)
VKDREASLDAGQAIVYCVIPRDLAPELHDLLKRHFRQHPSVEVIVEGRFYQRRVTEDRRQTHGRPESERRKVLSVDGCRISERRAVAVEVAALALPRRAQPFADRLVFMERLAPSSTELEDSDTARLVARIQAGDHDLFAQLYLRYFDRVYSYLRILMRDDHEAEDAAQQVFMRVMDGLPRYERRSQPFRAWLFVIVRNLALTQLKRQNRVDLVDPAEMADRYASSADADLGALDWINDREILMLIERLPLTQRQVLLLRFMLDLTHAETAAVLGRTPNEIRKAQGRALSFLRTRLTSLGRRTQRSGPAGFRRPLTQVRVLRQRRYALL